MNPRAWKACAKKWRSIVNQVDAECMQATECEVSAKRELRSLAERVQLLEAVATKAQHISEDAFYTDDGQQMLIDPGFIRELRERLAALDAKGGAK